MYTETYTRTLSPSVRAIIIDLVGAPRIVRLSCARTWTEEQQQLTVAGRFPRNDRAAARYYYTDHRYYYGRTSVPTRLSAVFSGRSSQKYASVGTQTL